MRQVDQRISVRCELGPLTRDGVGEYVKHRLWVAGLEPDQQPFLPAAIDEVFKASRGIPRMINLICDRALQRGFDQQLSLIGPDLITRAVIELDLGSLVPGSPEAVTVDSEVNAAVADAAPVANRTSTTAARVLESPNELDLETLSDLDPPPPEWLAGDDEFEEAGDEAGKTGGREGVLGLGVSDQRYDADLEGDPDWYVVLRRAARAVALLMLAAVLVWGGWRLWLKMSVPSSAVPAPISATPSAP
jgi:hypothetical protein